MALSMDAAEGVPADATVASREEDDDEAEDDDGGAGGARPLSALRVSPGRWNESTVNDTRRVGNTLDQIAEAKAT